MINSHSRFVEFVARTKSAYHRLVNDRILTKKEAKKTKARLKTIGGGYNGSSEEYKRVVLGYWKKFKKQPEKCWYDLFCAGAETYDPRYIPNSIWLIDILEYFNDPVQRFSYTNKAMYNRFIGKVKKPETVVKKIGAYYFDGDGDNLITEEEAKRLILQEEHIILKPSLETFGGSGIVFYDKGKPFDIDAVFRNLRKGFVAQRLIKQHADLAKINSESVNTIRVITLHFKGDIRVISTVLRMGTAGARVDNTTAGGCACPIKPDGWLVEKAVNRKSEWTDRHESSGILFKDIHVPCFERVLEAAKIAHSQLPYFNLVGWDFSVDESGEPVMIEYNLLPEQNQISGGPTFGDLTDEVLKDVFIKRSLRSKA